MFRNYSLPQTNQNWQIWSFKLILFKFWELFQKKMWSKSMLVNFPPMFYGIWISKSGAMVCIHILDKVLQKKLFPTMNGYKIRKFNIENQKCTNGRKLACTGLWKWFLWLGNSILSNFYQRHLILGWIL